MIPISSKECPKGTFQIILLICILCSVSCIFSASSTTISMWFLQDKWWWEDDTTPEPAKSPEISDPGPGPAPA